MSRTIAVKGTTKHWKSVFAVAEGNIFFLVGIRGKRERFLNCPLVTFEWENSITKFRRNLMTKISQDES
ncbi:MAG: hypothetical protein K9N46_15815, partial [Candidatus Marinimicrobia bacterium]|nr:hypothetical protein [Candidatus Neomarinimicrobiota bacterium]MCF7830289.1 hypothetical protein [Candidatus Neomarinimicrobiota bacterium]MCF7882198.1 hypothetical protein [Candidatus Neomarinimicrobiota bacterium]